MQCLSRSAIAILLTGALPRYSAALTYTVVDTGQQRCYNDRAEIVYPGPGEAWFGQDAQYEGLQPAYRDNGDGTVSDLNTGLMWQADPSDKMTFTEAAAAAAQCRAGGYDDWRLPTIKELYSLIQFDGTDPDPMSGSAEGLTPFMDTRYFGFRYGDADSGERVIDAQFATCTKYVGTTLRGRETMLGVNFADGRIKGYPIDRRSRRPAKTFFVLYVRGNPDYGKNDFVDNGDGTLTDRATGLMWMKVDSAAFQAGKDHDGRLNWREALEWAENLEYAGHSDWRLPNAKELQSIVDYTRSPDTTRSAAIDPIFEATQIVNEGGEPDYAHYWTGTTHSSTRSAESAVYIAFGRAIGFMARVGAPGEPELADVHGAGAQRSDPKVGDASRFPQGRGPQGDVIRIDNLVRCVRAGAAEPRTTGPAIEMRRVPEPAVPPDNGHSGPPTGADFVRRLDRDGDSKLSAREFDGPANHFKDFDRDRNGYITADEAPMGPPSPWPQ